MKILLDENIPKRLKFDFVIDDEVSTVQELNWQGKRNNEIGIPASRQAGGKIILRF